MIYARSVDNKYLALVTSMFLFYYEIFSYYQLYLVLDVVNGFNS